MCLFLLFWCFLAGLFLKLRCVRDLEVPTAGIEAGKKKRRQLRSCLRTNINKRSHRTISSSSSFFGVVMRLVRREEKRKKRKRETVSFGIIIVRKKCLRVHSAHYYRFRFFFFSCILFFDAYQKSCPPPLLFLFFFPLLLSFVVRFKQKEVQFTFWCTKLCVFEGESLSLSQIALNRFLSIGAAV